MHIKVYVGKGELDLILRIAEWMQLNYIYFLTLLLRHLYLTILVIVLSIATAVPIGIAISPTRVLANVVINITNSFYSIPSLALFALFVPFFGIGITPALIALILYVQFIIITHTYVGLINVDPALLQVARGLGMRKWQQLLKVQLPLALPVIFAGVRTATTLSIGMISIAAYIGAGGLGVLIFRGIQSSNVVLIIIGSIPVFILSILVDGLLIKTEHIVVSKGLRVE